MLDIIIGIILCKINVHFSFAISGIYIFVCQQIVFYVPVFFPKV